MAKPSSRSQKSLKDALIQKESPNTIPHVVTLLGIMPWLNIPLSSKTQEVWALELEEVFMAQDTNEPKMDPKLLKLKQVVDLCETFGVVLQKEVVMGFPLKWMVVEKITSLHATWVVFDRYQKRKRRFFAHRIPCNMVIMNENSEADMIKGQPMIDNGELSTTPFSLIPTPQLIISDGCMAGQGQNNNHIMRN